MKQHKTKRKRLLVLALCLLTALSMLPVTAMAGAACGMQRLCLPGRNG